MKPPVVEVDFHTPAEQFRQFEDASGRIGFIVESEMAKAPRNMPWQEVLKTFVRYIDVSAEPGTGRIIPSRINMLTAPTLCGVLRDSEPRYEEQLGVWVEAAVGVIDVMSWWAGEGGGLKGVTAVAGRAERVAAKKATKAVMSRPAKRLVVEMEPLLEKGGIKKITVEGVEFSSVQVE